MRTPKRATTILIATAVAVLTGGLAVATGNSGRGRGQRGLPGDLQGHQPVVGRVRG